jgi:hypothetical protein
VRNVGHEAALRHERSLQAGQETVDRVAELLDLILGPGQRKALVQVFLRDVACPCGDQTQRREHPPGHDPTQPHRDQCHDRQRDPRPQQQRVQHAVPLRRDPDRSVPGDRRGVVMARRRERRPLNEQIGDRQQRRTAPQEQRAVDRRQAQAHTPAGTRPSRRPARHAARAPGRGCLRRSSPRLVRPVAGPGRRSLRRHRHRHLLAAGAHHSTAAARPSGIIAPQDAVARVTPG